MVNCKIVLRMMQSMNLIIAFKSQSFIIGHQYSGMFKKSIKIGAQNQLSGKDKKVMKSKLLSLFDEPCTEKILALNDKIISIKVSGSKMLVYSGNDYPLFVDGTGKGDFFPSLYTAQAYEPFIKCLDINEGVESFIYNGANLMWPGVRNCHELGQFKKDQVVGIRSAKGEVIAIGAMGCSFKEFQDKTDINGVAIYILHFKGDKLWDIGPKTNPEVIVAKPKPVIKEESLKEEVTEEKPKKEKKKKNDNEETQKKQQKSKNEKKPSSPEKEQKSASQSEESDDNDGFMNMVHSGNQARGRKQEVKMVEKKKPTPVVFSDEQDDRKGKKKGKKEQKKKQQKKEESSEEEEMQEKQEKKKGKKNNKAKKEESSENSGEEQEKEEKPKSVISAKLMDQYLKECFLNAIKLSKVDSELPIDSGRFFIDYMLLARPEGVKLEVKDSSYKKLGKFYEEMAKQKFIEFKHSKDKKGQQGATINKIFWENKQLSEYEPTILRINDKELESKEEEIVGKKKLNLSKTLIVETAYKPNADLCSVLFKKKVNLMPTEEEEVQIKKQEEEKNNRPTHYSETQIKALIEKYINEIAEGKSKREKVQKMVPINYEKNAFISDLLSKQIENFQENQLDDEDDDDEQMDEGEKKNKGKKKVRMFRIDRALLVNKMLKKCSVSYHVVDEPNEVSIFAEGTFKGLQLIAEKTNNKNITKIIGLETFIVPRKEADEQMNGLASQLQQKFACSVNIQNLPGKNAGKELVVHGNFINELEEMFVGEYGLKAEYITSQNKLDKKKKKK